MFLGKIHTKKAAQNCVFTTMTSSEDVVEEENNNALWRLFRNAGAFSGGVCRDVVERHVLPRLNRNEILSRSE